MTTFVQFTPSPTQTFTFQGVFDGETYQLQVRWNVFGRRWYVICLHSNDVLLFNVPLIGSPQNGDVNLAAGYYQTSTLIFREHTQQFEISP